MRRRDLLKTAGGLFVVGTLSGRRKIMSAMPLPGGTLDPRKYCKIPDAASRPASNAAIGEIDLGGGKKADYYEIAVRQFNQQVLPSSLPDHGLGVRRNGAAGHVLLSSLYNRSNPQ